MKGKFFLGLVWLIQTASIQAQHRVEIELKNAFQKGVETVNDTELEALKKKYEHEFKNVPTASNRYWNAYALYQQSLLNLVLEHNDKAEQLCEQTLTLLQTEEANTEQLALLSLVLGFSTQFKGYWAMIRLGQEAYITAEKALEMDTNNIRALYVLAINDFYTPKIFGGGKRVESLLQKALSLPESNSSQSPTWGREEAFELIVKYYREKKQNDLADQYLKKGLQAFPNSTLLKAQTIARP